MDEALIATFKIFGLELFVVIVFMGVLTIISTLSETYTRNLNEQCSENAINNPELICNNNCLELNGSIDYKQSSYSFDCSEFFCYCELPQNITEVIMRNE